MEVDEAMGPVLKRRSEPRAKAEIGPLGTPALYSAGGPMARTERHQTRMPLTRRQGLKKRLYTTTKRGLDSRDQLIAETSRRGPRSRDFSPVAAHELRPNTLKSNSA